MRTLVLFVLVLVVSAGCARTHLFYDARELRHPTLEGNQHAALAQTVADRLHGKNVTWVDDEGKEHAVQSDVAGFSKLGLPELGALWLATSSGDVGGESDVRVHVKSKSVPVTVLIGLDGAIRVESGKNDPPDEPALSEQEIREKYQLHSTLPGKWHERERRALVESLDLLRPEELAVVQTLALDRTASSPDHDPAKAALYEMQGCRAVIYLFSSGVLSDAYRFVGEPLQPKSAVLHSLVHEIGHAFEQSSARHVYCEATKAKGDKANALVHEGDALTQEGPVLKEYMKILNGEPAPTDYGNTSPHESFAESFALFHVDPAALKRTRPAVFDWFAHGGHVHALNVPST